MAERTCLNCMYVRCDPGVWLRCLAVGEPLVPRCANHPWWPGQMHDVSGVPCRNYEPKPPEPGDGTRQIPLGDGNYALVDTEDYEWLSRYNWHLSGGGYATRYENGKTMTMHREIMQPPKGMIVDHMNHARADNRRINLRVCTHTENQRNQRRQKRSRTRFKGVQYTRDRERCFARIMFEGRQIWLGYHDDEVTAARAYDRAAVEYFGEFASLNFPEDWPMERIREVHAERQTAGGKRKARNGKAKRRRGRDGRDTIKSKPKTKTGKARRARREGGNHNVPGAKRKTTDATRTMRDMRGGTKSA